MTLGMGTGKHLWNGRRRLLFSSWNVQSLVEDTGDVRVCRKAKRASRVDRGLDFLTQELTKQRVAVAGIQETRWFGNDVWPTADGLFLHSGRPVPAVNEPARRNEGVGIWMNKAMTVAWNNGGQQWKAVSSRIVWARFLLCSAGQSFGGKARRSSVFLSVVSVYAPTSKATPAVKENFFHDLQSLLDGLPKKDILVVLGDFNARVGSFSPLRAGEQTGPEANENTLGRFGFGERNAAGEQLLLFCAANNLSVMNTWFRPKKRSHAGTWSHPATGQPHLIDFVIMRQDQRVFCQNVRVVRSATFWTDHNMVEAKLRLDFTQPRKPRGHRVARFAVERLRDKQTARIYQSILSEQCETTFQREQLPIEQEWAGLKSDVAFVASEILGRSNRRQPDWFVESQPALEPLLAEKSRLHQAMLSRDTRSSRKAFRRAQRAVAAAVRCEKEEWICDVANTAEDAKKDGKVRWQCLQKLQGAHAGRKPATPTSVLDESGHLTGE